MADQSLPELFSDLEPFAATWALDNQEQRIRHLDATPLPELRAFYDGMMPRMDEVIDYLNGFPLDAMPAAEARLMALAMTFAETAHPIDLRWKTTKIESPYAAERLKLVGASQLW